MKKVLSGVLMLALTAMSVPMAAAEKPAAENVKTAAATARGAAPIAGALKDAGLSVAPRVETARASASNRVPVALPRKSGRTRKDVTMMVTTLVGSAVGLAGTVYMMKQLKKNTEEK